MGLSLERRGWIKARWGASEHNRRAPILSGRAKYYALTRPGRRQLQAEQSAWRKLTEAIGLIVDAEFYPAD